MMNNNDCISYSGSTQQTYPVKRKKCILKKNPTTEIRRERILATLEAKTLKLRLDFDSDSELKASLLNLQLLRKHGMDLKSRFPLCMVTVEP